MVIEDNFNFNIYNFLFVFLSYQYFNGLNSQDMIISDVLQIIDWLVCLIQGGLGFVDLVIYFVVLGDV